MKKIYMGLITFIIIMALGFIFLNCIDNYYTNKIKDKYYDEIGYELSTQKNMGLELQKKSLQREDNILIYGSSELSGKDMPTHPRNFFYNKESGFQVNLIGRGHCQSIIHAINLQALKNDLKGKKIVFIISPQWFDRKGLSTEGFNMNVSELQFYKFMFDKSIEKTYKLRAAKRINDLLNDGMDNINIKSFSYLYSKDNILSKGLLNILTPYYKLKQYILSIKDKINTYKIMNGYKDKSMVIDPQIKNFNWIEENKNIDKKAKYLTNNNEFGILNDYYNTYIKSKVKNLKGAYKNITYTQSLEYDDLKYLLDTCKSIKVKPLFVSVPVHGKWYDYCEFSKEDRNKYYKKINNMVKSYDFDLLDMSKYEYEKYFLKDTMHLGWKGWLHLNEAIAKYYNNN